MQPSVNAKIRSRLRAARVPASTSGLTFGLVLLGLWLILAGSARAAAAPGWENVEVRKWDWNEVRALPNGQEILDAELHRQGEYNRRWHMVHDLLGGQHISHLSQELLKKQGLGASRLNIGDDRRGLTKAIETDTLRVLLVRIGFEANRDSQLTTIVPGGDFMLDPLADPGPLEIDPPPHNKAFFESHLTGLTEYYKFMSGGRLQIEGTVLPAGENDSYKLSDVADYGPGAGNFWSLESLEKLVQDVITTADAGLIADGVGNGLADYDDETPFTYVIFVHAGSDWQSDIRGDSPNDIPTFFVTLGEPVALIGTNPGGQPGQLSECSIIPETTNQDDSAGSIAAAFYHEFGHALGLPDVYNTQTGLPAVGIWDLMDSGTNLPVTLGTVTAEDDTVFVAATGVLPPSLSAWCKWYLGWIEMGEVSAHVPGKDEYLLPAVGVPRDQYGRYDAGFGDFNLEYPQAYRAGLSPREYFLIENRWVPESVAQTPFTELYFEGDDDTGVIQYLAGVYQGVPENSGLYDYFMPAGGLLVWHVNADRIASELANNTINAYGDGLRLVEADGIQDIGVINAFVQGWFGSWRDPFGGLDSDGFATGFADLYRDQFPSSRNFDRSYSGLRLSEMGPRVPRTAAVMTFQASLDPVLDGFPWEVAAIGADEGTGDGSAEPRMIEPSSLTPLTTGGEQVLVFSDKAGPDWQGGVFPSSLYGLRPNGQPRWGTLPDRAEGAFWVLGAPQVGPPLALEHPVSGTQLVWATVKGLVGSLRLTGLAPELMSVTVVADSLVAGPVPMRWQETETRTLVAAYPDNIFLLGQDGLVMGSGLQLETAGNAPVTEMDLTVLPFAGAATDLAVVFTAQGWYLVSQDGDGLLAETTFTPYENAVNGVPDWTVVTPLPDGEVKVSAFDEAGEVGSWSVSSAGQVRSLGAQLELDGPLVCAPAVADVDGDGRHDMVLATATRIYGFKDDGISLRGFPVRFYDLYPLADSTRVAGPLIVADATGDGVNDVFFNTTGGHLMGLNATGRLMNDVPLRWGDGAAAGMAVGGTSVDRILWLVSSGGYTDGFLDRIPINGRVSAYGMLPVATDEMRTSEWLGPRGGIGRSGPSGQAQALGATAPISAEMEQVYLYPNPLSTDDVTVRFYSQGSRAARVAIYNLEGELVARKEAPVTAGAVNEIVLPLPGVASGMYLARVEFEGTGGLTIRTMTLAVEK